MKAFWHTLAVLAAALVVAGLTYGFGQSSYAASMFPERHQRPATAEQLGTGQVEAGLTTETAPDGAVQATREFAHEHHEHEEGPSIFGVGEVIKNLLLVGVIVGLTRLLARGRRLVLRRG